MALQSFACGGDHRHDAHLLCLLTIASNSCRACNATMAGASLNNPKERQTMEEDLEEKEFQQTANEIANIESTGGLSREHLHASMAQLKGHKILHGAHNKEAQPSQALRSMVMDIHDNDIMDDGIQEDNQQSAAAKASRESVRNWQLESMQCFQRQTSPIALPVHNHR